MKCIFCGARSTSVARTRRATSQQQEDKRDKYEYIVRERVCDSCGRGFSTTEVPSPSRAIVIKDDGDRELFDAQKLFGSIKAAYTEKMGSTQRDVLIRVLRDLAIDDGTEIGSRRIGELVLEHLRLENKGLAWMRYSAYYDDQNHLERLVVQRFLKDEFARLGLNYDDYYPPKDTK